MVTGLRRTLSATVLVAALAGALAACGDDSGTVADPAASTSPAGSATSDPSSSPSEPSSSSSSAVPSGPACAKVWKGDATLPGSYHGCTEGDSYVGRDVLGCSSGQRIVRYGDHFYATLGGRIHETESVLDKDRGYRDAVAVCRG